VDGYGFYGVDTEGFFDVYGCWLDCGSEDGEGALTSETVQAELVYPRQRVRVLPIILDYVYVVRRSKKTGECGTLGIPERGGNNAFTQY
jgi:hypothetical protein